MAMFKIIKNWLKKKSEPQIDIIEGLFGDESQIRKNIAKCHQICAEIKARQKLEKEKNDG